MSMSNILKTKYNNLNIKIIHFILIIFKEAFTKFNIGISNIIAKCD